MTHAQSIAQKELYGRRKHRDALVRAARAAAKKAGREVRDFTKLLLHNWPAWGLGLALGVMLLAGCAHQVNAPLPAGALNTFDADSFRTLADAHAAVQSIQGDVAGGKLTLDDGQKTVLNKAITDVNMADHAYKLYHAQGAGDTAGLTQAIQQVIGDLASLSTAFPKTPPAK